MTAIDRRLIMIVACRLTRGDFEKLRRRAAELRTSASYLIRTALIQANLITGSLSR